MEILVVIGIVAVLIALLLPALQSAREGARRTQCANNLRQWGLAMQQYENNRLRFPPGAISYGLAGTSSADRRTFVMSLWPFLDAQVVLGQYDLAKPFWDPVNRSAVDARVPIYYCPSDRPGAQWRGNQYWHARGNYVCNWGNSNFAQNEPTYKKAPFSEYRNPTAPEPGNAAGAFRDGLSNTIFMSELVMPARDEDFDVRGSIVNNTAGGASFMTKNTPNSGTDYCDCWASKTYPGPTVSVNGTVPGWNSARSLHAGGVTVCLGDASTRFVPDGISLAIWQQYGTIRELEPVDPLP